MPKEKSIMKMANTARHGRNKLMETGNALWIFGTLMRHLPNRHNRDMR
jgi:hypothetical protein